jgi:hypothetical protein
MKLKQGDLSTAKDAIRAAEAIFNDASRESEQ